LAAWSFKYHFEKESKRARVLEREFLASAHTREKVVVF